MKKILFGSMLLAIAAVFLAGPVANAQLFPYVASNTATDFLPTTTTMMATATMQPTSTMVISSTLSAPSSSPLLPTPVSTLAAEPAPVVGFIQFNDLQVESFASGTAPVSTNISTTSTTPSSCTEFATEDSVLGSPITCPMIAYQIEVSSSTQIMLSDRTPATLANLTPSDIVDVFGYYDGIGDIQANVIRDLSKPVGINATTTLSLTAIQTEIQQIQTVLSQLIQEIQMLSSSATTATTTVMASSTMAP